MTALPAHRGPGRPAHNQTAAGGHPVRSALLTLPPSEALALCSRPPGPAPPRGFHPLLRQRHLGPSWSSVFLNPGHRVRGLPPPPAAPLLFFPCIFQSLKLRPLLQTLLPSEPQVRVSKCLPDVSPWISHELRPRDHQVQGLHRGRHAAPLKPQSSSGQAWPDRLCHPPQEVASSGPITSASQPAAGEEGSGAEVGASQGRDPEAEHSTDTHAHGPARRFMDTPRCKERWEMSSLTGSPMPRDVQGTSC